MRLSPSSLIVILALLGGASAGEWSDDVVQRFAKILTFKTVSNVHQPKHVQHPDEFKKLHAWLADAFPDVWSKLEVTVVNDFSLLLKWQGSDASLPPALFISHLDVVPIAPGSERDWTHPPFGGVIADGYVWGRGALDVKVTAIAMLEAVRSLLAQGFSPQQTYLFAFGHDEEVGGEEGAGHISALLQQQGVTQLEVILDEGGQIQLEGFQPFTTYPTMIIGTAEKGYTSVEVGIKTGGGHSSRPPINHTSAAAVMARVITAIDTHPTTPLLTQPVIDFLKGVAPRAEIKWRSLLARADNPGVAKALAQIFAKHSPELAAMVHTTAAVTQVHAGVADNVLPQTATVGVNFRTLPGDDVDTAIAYVRSLISEADKALVEHVAKPDWCPQTGKASAVTPADGKHFKLVAQAVQQVWKVGADVPMVVPFLMLGGTDSGHYANMSQGGVLRFNPYSVSQAAGDLERFHGTNERLLVKDYPRTICTFQCVMLKLSGAACDEAAAAGKCEYSDPPEAPSREAVETV